MLRLQVLGSPSVNREGRPCGGAAAQRKALALLALLAAAGRSGVGRDKMFAWLWPETTADKATHRLAQLLYSLRRELGDELLLPSLDLRLNPGVLPSDLMEFSAALESGDFTRAVAAYGGPFLDGFYLSDAPEFEHWVEQERARLAQRHSAALEALARNAAAGGDVNAAAGWWRQLSQAEPLNPRVAVSYMEALCAAGDRPSALRFAKAYETLLRQEFDTEPDPEVTAAAERLKSLPAASDVSGVPPAPAVAVLPFLNLTPEGENQYFSDGLTEDLINALAQVAGLRVASRTSVYALRGKDLDARELAERLGVTALVEGSVRKVGNRIQLTARLVDAADGCQLWCQRYERTMDEVFALEEELSKALAAALPAATRPAPAPQMRRPTTDPDAYTLYLRGRYSANKRTPEGLSLAIEYFEQAVELDPDYALGHAGLAECWAILGFAPEFGAVAMPQASTKARAAALEALRLEPGLAQAHNGLALVHFLYDWDWTSAEREFRRAIQLDPGYAIAETWYAVFLSAMGRHEESLSQILHAEAIEPLALPIRLSVGRCYYFARRYEQAYLALSAVLKDEPGHPQTLNWMALTLCALGRQTEALELLEQVPSSHRTPYVRSLQALALAGLRQTSEALALCDALEQEFDGGSVFGLFLIGALGLLGERDRAVRILERALHRRDPSILWLRSQPAYDSISHHPQVQRALADLRLVSAARE